MPAGGCDRRATTLEVHFREGFLGAGQGRASPSKMTMPFRILTRFSRRARGNGVAGIEAELICTHSAAYRLEGIRYQRHLPAMAHELPPSYPQAALEPHIDALTMEIHHGRHHKAYVDNLVSRPSPVPRWNRVP